MFCFCQSIRGEVFQLRYLTTRNMTMQVISMPPTMRNLSWLALFSIRRITVLDNPSMFATSSIFLCVPCRPRYRKVNRIGKINKQKTRSWNPETHLERAPLVAQAVEDARAGAEEVVHASVRVVQAGIELKCVVYGDGGVCVLTHSKRIN